MAAMETRPELKEELSKLRQETRQLASASTKKQNQEGLDLEGSEHT